MVQGQALMISAFARAAGMSNDTVRFYVRRGLLHPAHGSKGGANPYQLFGPDQLARARMIRTAQALGFSLREVAALIAEYEGGMSPERTREVTASQLDRLDRQAEALDRMRRYLRAKLAWFDAGATGSPPTLDDSATPLTELGPALTSSTATSAPIG